MARKLALAPVLGATRDIAATAFLPDRTASRGVYAGIFAVHTIVAIWFWYNNPWKVIPMPLDIWRAFLDLWNQGLIIHHFKESMKTFGLAVLLSTVVSFGIGYLSTIAFFKPLGWIISKFRFWGLVGLQFIFTVIFGAGLGLKVAITSFGISVFLTPAIIAIVNGVSQARKDDAWTISRNMNEWKVLWYTTIRGTLHLTLEALRQNAAIGWVMLIFVEAIVQSLGGAGALMIRNDKYQKLDYVYAIQCCILLVGIVQDLGFHTAIMTLCPQLKGKRRGR